MRQLFVVRQLAQITHRKRLAILELPIELLLQVVVHLAHGVPVAAVQHVVVRRPELRATPHALSSRSLRMRKVHCKCVVENEEREARLTQVLHKLHLVVAVVHEPLVEQRQLRRQTNQQVRLHEVCHKATNARHVRRRRRHEPFRHHVHLHVNSNLGGHVGANQTLVRHAVASSDAGNQIELVFGLVEVSAICDRATEAVQESAILHRIAMLQHCRVVEEKDGQNNRGRVTSCDKRRQRLQLVVSVGYD